MNDWTHVCTGESSGESASKPVLSDFQLRFSRSGKTREMGVGIQGPKSDIHDPSIECQSKDGKGGCKRNNVTSDIYRYHYKRPAVNHKTPRNAVPMACQMYNMPRPDEYRGENDLNPHQIDDLQRALALRWTPHRRVITTS